MAIDISIDGISVQASATGVSVSIDDLAGLGIDFEFDIPVDGGGVFPFLGDGGGPDGEMEALLGEFTPGTPLFASEDGPGPGADTTDGNSFDGPTLASLTLLGGADDTAGPDDGIDPLTNT